MSVSAIGLLQPTSPVYTTPLSGAATAPVGTGAGATPRLKPGQFRSDFASMLQAVQSGDITTAQQALTAVQSDIAGAGATYSAASSAGGTQLPPDLQNLFDSVQKGDTTAAQAALTKLESDAQQQAQSPGASGVHGHHHHHKHGGASAASGSSSSTSTSSATDPTTTDPTAIDATTTTPTASSAI